METDIADLQYNTIDGIKIRRRERKGYGDDAKTEPGAERSLSPPLPRD